MDKQKSILPDWLDMDSNTVRLLMLILLILNTASCFVPNSRFLSDGTLQKEWFYEDYLGILRDFSLASFPDLFLSIILVIFAACIFVFSWVAIFNMTSYPRRWYRTKDARYHSQLWMILLAVIWLYWTYREFFAYHIGVPIQLLQGLLLNKISIALIIFTHLAHCPIEHKVLNNKILDDL